MVEPGRGGLESPPAELEAEVQRIGRELAGRFPSPALHPMRSLDQKAICDSLHAKGAATTFAGHLSFDPTVNNFWPTNLGIKQIQNGDWVMVWPPTRAAGTIKGAAS